MKSSPTRLLFFSCLLTLTFLFFGCRVEKDDFLDASSIRKVAVWYVVDGDTIRLENKQYVRFLGVDTPEMTTKPPEKGAVAATNFTKSKIGEYVWLEADGPDRDQYNRLLRYVWLREPVNPRDEKEIREYQLNALLLEHKHAKTMMTNNIKNGPLLKKIEQEAKKK